MKALVLAVGGIIAGLVTPTEAAPWKLRVVLVEGNGVPLAEAKVFIQRRDGPRTAREACPGGICSFGASGLHRLDVFAGGRTTQIREVYLEARDQTVVIETQPHFSIDPALDGTGRIKVLLERRELSPNAVRWVRIVSLFESVSWDAIVSDGSIISARLPSGQYMVLDVEGARIRSCAIIRHNELTITTIDLLDLRFLDRTGNGVDFATEGCRSIKATYE